MSVSNAYGQSSLGRDRWGGIRFRAGLMKAAGQAVIASNPVVSIVYWNRATEKMCGWSPEVVVGRSAGDVLISGDLREERGKVMVGLGDTWYREFPVGDQPFAPARRHNCRVWMTITQRRRAHR